MKSGRLQYREKIMVAAIAALCCMLFMPQASFAQTPPPDPPPTGASCPIGEADLSAAIAFGNSKIGGCYKLGGGHPNPTAAGCYDCSGFNSAIANLIPGYTGGTRLANELYKFGSTMHSTTKPVGRPVYFVFSEFGSVSRTRWGHVFMNVCGNWYNAANPEAGIIDRPSSLSGTGKAGPWVAEYGIPKGLESLTEASCSAACSPGCADGHCEIPADTGSGCETLVGYWDQWWEGEFLPAMKDMTAQLYAWRVNQSKLIGNMKDAVNVNRAARMVQERKLDSQQAFNVNENTCTAASFGPALTEAVRTNNQLTQGFKWDHEHTADPMIEHAARWATYCNRFQDPKANNGISGCPETKEGTIPNGDISIEGFLLKDTINLADPNEYVAAHSILANLTRQKPLERIPESTLNTVDGRMYLLLQQRLTSLHNITRDIVASIVSRRNSINPATGAAVSDLVKQIRTKAGVDPAFINQNPSYNEIMLALTKERFFDPEYFARLQTNIDEIKKEQASIDAYTAVQMQDIYRMQEQINALLAVRAMLKAPPDSAEKTNRAVPIK